MPSMTGLGATAAAALLALSASRAHQAPAVRSMDEKVLSEYTGVYRWGPSAFMYLQLWNEFAGFNKPTATNSSPVLV
jgi:hypothetical protein